MNKKTLPILILILIVIVCIGILIRVLASPVPQPSSSTASSAQITSTLPQSQSQPAYSAVAPVNQSNSTAGKLTVIPIKAPLGTIQTEVASTSADQAQGLGDRTSLASGSGMLFPFMYPGDYGFWMKDMHFSLDMVWISSNKKVVGVAYDVTPDSYPTVFYPPVAISYVLELNAGDAKNFGVATDTQLVF